MSHAQSKADKWPTTTLWKREEGCPGALTMTTTLGPSAAKSHGCDVASVKAHATSFKMADIAAAHAVSLVTNRERGRAVRAAGRRSNGAMGAMRVGPVTAGVGTVGVIMLCGWGVRDGAKVAA